MKIGIYGGTFNPIHMAHLRIAEEVRERFELGEVIFIPAATPPHKPLAGELSFDDRFEMVRMGVADNPAFSVSDLEGRRGGKSYLIDTLRELRHSHPGDEFFFIMGSDSFADIGNWKEYAGYFSLCNIVVVERPGRSVHELAKTLPAEVTGDFAWFAAEKRLDHRSGYSVYFFQGTLLDVSSSGVRQLLRLGNSIRYLVPAAVEQYIKERGLYKHAQ